MRTATTLKKTYPFPSQFFDLPPYKLHYVDQGMGSPVILVHGNPSWSFMYRNLISSLAPHHHVLALDHMGCGLSDKPPVENYSYQLNQRIEDLTSFIDSFNFPEKVSLVLHDWGGPIGLGYATRFPEKINRLVLLNTAGFRWPKGKNVPSVLRFARTPSIGRFLIRAFNAFALGATFLGVNNTVMTRSIRDGYLFPYSSWKNRVSNYEFIRDIPLENTHPSYLTLKEVEESLWRLSDKKIMIGWGEKDFIFDRDILAEWKKYFPKASVRTFPSAGHYVLEDESADLISAIAFFLKDNPS